MIPWCLAALTAVRNALPSTLVPFLDVARPGFHPWHKPFVCTPFYLFYFYLLIIIFLVTEQLIANLSPDSLDNDLVQHFITDA